MASSSVHFSLFLFFITLSSSSLLAHARDSRFFNKVSSSAAAAVNNNNDVIPDGGKQPNFFRDENDNGYGLYNHPTTAAAAAEKQKPIHDYFPKNYNPVAYVTEAEGMTNESPAFTEGNVFTRNINYNDNGGGGFNGRPQRFNGGGVRPQGMSDTRFMENGRYYYDVNAERYGKNHPYVANAMREDGTRIENYNNNLYGNNGNAVEFNGEGFDEDEVEDEVKNVP